MHLSARILGTTTAKELEDRASAPVLIIGSDRFTRRDLGTIDCFNFLAAARLTKAIADLGPKNTRDLFERFAPSDLVVPSVGAVSLAVLGAAFEVKGIGGSQPLESWMRTHRAADSKREYVTFDTLKEKERKREKGEAKARRQRRNRKAARRNVAHAIRVERFQDRAADKVFLQ